MHVKHLVYFLAFNIGYCILVIFTVSQRYITGPEPVCLESNLTLSLWVLSTMLTLADCTVSDVQLVGLG